MAFGSCGNEVVSGVFSRVIVLSHAQNKPLCCLRASQAQESHRGVTLEERGALQSKKPSKKSNQLITGKGGAVLTLDPCSAKGDTKEWLSICYSGW